MMTWIFISQESSGMLSLLGMMEQCLKAGKKQSWHVASVTNICVGLLAGFKVLFIFFDLCKISCVESEVMIVISCV